MRKENPVMSGLFWIFLLC